MGYNIFLHLILEMRITRLYIAFQRKLINGGILQRLSTKNFQKLVRCTWGLIQTLYEENRTSYSEIDNLDDALHFLYELGAIGNAWKSKKGKHRTCWYYKIDAIDEVDLSQNFTIHYGLRKKFSLQPFNIFQHFLAHMFCTLYNDPINGKNPVLAIPDFQ